MILNPYSAFTRPNPHVTLKRSSRALGELMRLTSSLLVPLLFSAGCVTTLPEPTDTSTDTSTPHDPSCGDPSALIGLSFINVNNDEWDDLLLVYENGAWCVSINYGLLLQPQERVFVTPPAGEHGFRFTLGDLDGDGHADLAWGQATESLRYADLSIARWTDGAFETVGTTPLLINDPDVDPDDEASGPLCDLDELVIADLQGDGQAEVVVIDRDDSRWCARGLEADGLGEELEWFAGQGNTLARPLVGRVDGDACEDLVGFYQPTTDRPTETYMDGLWKLVGPSSEHPTAPCTPVGEADRDTNWRTIADQLGADAVYAAIADVDGDGDGDGLYATSAGDWAVALGSTAKQDWTFVPDATFTVSLGGGADLFASGDLNGDGLTDLLQLNVQTGEFVCAVGRAGGLELCPAGQPSW